MGTGKATLLDWFEEDIHIFVDGIGELRAHSPHCSFWLWHRGTLMPHNIVTELVNSIILSSVSKDDYRFWICDMTVYGRIDTTVAAHLSELLGARIIYNTVRPAIDLAAIRVVGILDDDIETFLRSLL